MYNIGFNKAKQNTSYRGRQCHDHQHEGGHKCDPLPYGYTPYAQTLEELSFDRSIWKAAMDGNCEKIEDFLINK
eukprot:Pgem_evm1s18000